MDWEIEREIGHELGNRSVIGKTNQIVKTTRNYQEILKNMEFFYTNLRLLDFLEFALILLVYDFS